MMGVHKGTDNFHNYREQKSAVNLRFLQDALQKARKRKRLYSSLSELVSEIQDITKIHRTTLTRNPLYHKELVAYLLEQPGAAARISVHDAPPEVLRAKLIDMELEMDRLRRERNAADTANARLAQTGSIESCDQGIDRTDWYTAFANTAATLAAILDTINKDFGSIRVDYQTGNILDLAAPKGRQLIAGGDRARAFIDYYRKLQQQEGKVV